jgi:hypothetical protein
MLRSPGKTAQVCYRRAAECGERAKTSHDLKQS